MEHTDCLSNSLLILSLAVLVMRRKSIGKKKRRRPRTTYMRQFYRDRRNKTELKTLVGDLRENDPELHYEHFRMSKDRYQHLLKLVEGDITHKNNHAVPISADERLGLTLRHGAEQRSKALSHVQSFCECDIPRNLPGDLEKSPRPVYTAAFPDMWSEAATRFWNKCQFPSCLGAIDGKHVEITESVLGEEGLKGFLPLWLSTADQTDEDEIPSLRAKDFAALGAHKEMSRKAPNNSGSKFFNYKEYFSIVLLACVDADYCFQYVDIGGYGCQSDGGTLSASELGKSLNDGTLTLPPPSLLPGTSQLMPHMFVADAAFPLRENLMRPYPEKNLGHGSRIFNYRLSRARRIVENAFGILVHRWRILSGPLQCEAETADLVVKAAVALHNYLIRTECTAAMTDRTYNPPGFSDTVQQSGEVTEGTWRATAGGTSLFRPVTATSLRTSNHHAETPAKNRDRLRDFFLSPQGRVPWQDQQAYR